MTGPQRAARPAAAALLVGALLTADVAPRGAAGTVPVGEGLQRFEFSEPHMGTTFRVVLYARDVRQAGEASGAAFARVADLDRRFSDYRSDSEVMRACRDAVRTPVPLSSDLFRVLATAHAMARHTNGAFDVTAGALTRVWRRARRLGELPLAADLDAARASSGHRLMRLGADDQALWLAREGVRIDLGGIGKGYAADRALDTMRAAGVEQAMVVAGGDVAVGAAPPGADGWHVAIAPFGPGDPAPVGAVVLAQAAISTSGDAEQWVDVGGVRYSHILDPRTGQPLTGERVVTVVARDATTSDMLATTASVLGPAAGAALVAGTPGASVLTGVRAEGGRVQWTRGGDATYFIW